MNDFHTVKPKTPIKAIREKCLDCSAGHANEVRHCSVHGCPLYPYRFGRRPRPDDVAGTQWDVPEPPPVSDEKRAAAAEHFRKIREAKARKADGGPKTA